MAKAGELDWSEELSKSETYRHAPTALWSATPGCGVDPLNKAEKILKDGEEPYRPSNEEISEHILKGVHNSPQAQWRDEDHLHREIVSQEQAEELEKNWENAIQGFYDAARANVVKEPQESKWGSGESFNSTLSEEERLKRNMFTGD